MHSQTFSKRVRTAYGWVLTGTAVRQGINFGISMLLARLLVPSDYGLVGMTTVFITILGTMQNLGIASAVVYFKDDDSKLPTYYTATLAVGTISTLLMWVSAPVIASFYNEPKIIPILRALGFLMLLGGFRSVSAARLAGSLEFKKLVVMENSVGIACGSVAVALAAIGFGAWSLVANWLLVALFQTVCVLYMMPARYTLHPDGAVLKKALKYGMPQMGTTLLWKVYDNSDYFVIGKILGTGPLGIYTVAFRVATLVNEKVSSVVTRVSFNAFAALKEHDRGRAHWLSLTDKIATINFALLGILAVMAEDIVLVILGAKWQPAIVPMRILCIVGALKTVSSITTPVLSANGRTDLTFSVSVANTIVLPIAFTIACLYGGIVGVAIAWCVLLPVSTAYIVHHACRITGLSPRTYLQTLKPSVTVGVMCMLGSLPVLLTMTPGLLRLLVGTSAGLICGGLVLLRHPYIRRLYGEWTSNRAARQAVG